MEEVFSSNKLLQSFRIQQNLPIVSPGRIMTCSHPMKRILQLLGSSRKILNSFRDQILKAPPASNNIKPRCSMYGIFTYIETPKMAQFCRYIFQHHGACGKSSTRLTRVSERGQRSPLGSRPWSFAVSTAGATRPRWPVFSPGVSICQQLSWGYKF